MPQNAQNAPAATSGRSSDQQTLGGVCVDGSAYPPEVAALIHDGLCWRRWWSAEMVAMRAEQHENEIAERVRAALLLRDGPTTPEQVDALKQAAVAISTSRQRWEGLVSHAELTRRRAAPGLLARPVDREALARWVRTGSSRPQETAA